MKRCSICRTTYTGSERYCALDAGAIVDDEQEDLLIGKTLADRFFVTRLLGRGGMGSVYLSDHVGLDKRVALKFLTRGTPDALARFRREARIASRITHENVVHLYDVGTSDGVDFIAMEYVEGRDLARVLREDGALEPARVVELGRQMLAGLAAVHAAGIVHRDIKPSNVIVVSRRDREVAKIMDFGIAKGGGAGADTLTEAGAVIGTPMYMSPEQLTGAPVDLRADLYAVGLTLFELLAGTPAFPGGSTAEIAAKQLEANVPSLAELRPGTPPALIAAIERSLAKSPTARFSDAMAFAAALDGRADELARTEVLPAATAATKQIVEAKTEVATISERPPLPPPPHSRSWLVPAALLGAITIAGVVYVATRSTAAELAKPPPPPPPTSAVDAAPVVTSPLVRAREAEAARNWKDALALYLDAYAKEPLPDTAMRIAELYERDGNTADAVLYLHRYLHDARDPNDRAEVIARIAKLEPGPAAIDAGAARTPTIQAPTVPKDTRRCICQKQWQPLCKTKGPSLCACRHSGGDWLCPVPSSACPMNQGDCTAQGFRCESTTFRDLVTPGTHGDPCHGWNTWNGESANGTLYCDVCRETAHYSPPADAACEGFDIHTGAPAKGAVICH